MHASTPIVYVQTRRGTLEREISLNLSQRPGPYYYGRAPTMREMELDSSL
jgi:hypothetical protein